MSIRPTVYTLTSLHFRSLAFAIWPTRQRGRWGELVGCTSQSNTLHAKPFLDYQRKFDFFWVQYVCVVYTQWQDVSFHVWISLWTTSCVVLQNSALLPSSQTSFLELTRKRCLLIIHGNCEALKNWAWLKKSSAAESCCEFQDCSSRVGGRARIDKLSHICHNPETWMTDDWHYNLHDQWWLSQYQIISYVPRQHEASKF